MAAISSHNGFFPLSALQPDQRRHSAGRAVPPEREETRRVGEGAQVAAARPADAGARQAPAREAVEIREPAPGRRRREAAGCIRVIGDEDLAHLVADLEGQGSNGRPSQARRSAGAPGARATVCSSTPAARPRQPAWAAATQSPRRLQNRTGRQSAVKTAQTAPRRLVAEASAAQDSPSPGPASATSHPCTWCSQNGSAGSASAARSRRRFSATCAGSSPTCSARFRLSQGLPLTPPERVVIATRTDGGAGQSG